jgi:hypothetical protein
VNDGPHYKKDGTKSTRKGDYMEFPDIAKKLNMKIDIIRYLDETKGMCARFINDYDRYQPPPKHKTMQIEDSDKRDKQIDAYSHILRPYDKFISILAGFGNFS